MKLPKEVVTESIVSKLLSAVVYVVLPFIGFFAGMQYQAAIRMPPDVQEQVEVAAPIPSTTPPTVCASDKDCPSGKKCTMGRPLVAMMAPHMGCWTKEEQITTGSASPVNSSK